METRWEKLRKQMPLEAKMLVLLKQQQQTPLRPSKRAQ
jgi:hypothetical protein